MEEGIILIVYVMLIALGPKYPMCPKIQCAGAHMHTHLACMHGSTASTVGTNLPTATKLNHITDA